MYQAPYFVTFTFKAHPAKAGVAKPRVLALLRDAAPRVSYRRPQESTTAELPGRGDDCCLPSRARGTRGSSSLLGCTAPPAGSQVYDRGRCGRRGQGRQMQRISNGRIEEEWAGFNTLGALQEIGALPRLGQPAVAAR